MRILHLAFEDHRRSGSGGGSLRNREINRRLVARGHEVEVLAAAYRGCRSRNEDGVRYRHLGLPRGYVASLMTYQAALPAAAALAIGRLRPDLVVEEFAPPTTSVAVGHWTRRPTVGMVQGYFAREKARQYKLPLRPMLALERWGTRSHRHLIAVSDDLARRLRAAAPTASVTVVANGVDHVAVTAALAAPDECPPADRSELVFLGRLEFDQKGVDLLLRAFAEIVRRRPTTRLTIAGDGKDARRVAQMVAELGLETHVRLAGRVTGTQKWRMLAAAAVVLVPSRYETFGITALEAMACGTPVVAYDIHCLRDIVDRGGGVLVEPFDTGAYATAVLALLADPTDRRRRGDRGRAAARAYDWDALCTAQEAVYELAASTARAGR